MKRTVDLGLCLTLSLVLVFGSVLSLSDTKMASAIDMSDAPATQDTTTAGSGEGDEDQGDNNDDQEDDPVTQETITAGGGSEDNNDKDNSGQNNNDNKNEPTTTDTKVTNKLNCPKGQESGLFTTCMPIQTCSNQIDVHCCGSAAPILSDENSKCVNAPLVDHPSTED
jgi:hypothetical protein